MSSIEYDKDGFDKHGYHRLHVAAHSGDLKEMKAQLNSRVDIELKTKDENKRTGLYLACADGNVECARELLNRKANPNALTSYKWTPLMRSVSSGKVDCV